MADAASLQNLQDIIEPATVAFWPPAPGIWLLMALVLLWSSAGIALLWLRWRKNAYRRAGLQELRRIRQRLHKDDLQLAIQEVATLLKRVALSAFARNQVASLSGDRWLLFLDATMGGGSFSAAPGRLLSHALYRPAMASADLSERQVDELFGLAGAWIKRHRTALPADTQSGLSQHSQDPGV